VSNLAHEVSCMLDETGLDETGLDETGLDETALATMRLQWWPLCIHYRHNCREEVPTQSQEYQVPAISLNGLSQTTLRRR
jgi:hypothetical protein